MEAELIRQGVDLMLFGMGTVFAFLTVLVASTVLMSAFIDRFFPEEAAVESVQKSVITPGKQPVDARTLKVIQEAVYQHRAKTK